MPSDTAVFITADHGMVDAPHALRIDLAHDAELAAGVRHVGGEFRSLQLYCEEGAAPDVARHLAGAAWASGPGCSAARRRSRQGWFGPVAPHVLERIGDVIVAMRDNFAIVDSRTARPELLALLGLHGSLTHEEVSIPLLHARPATAPRVRG